MNELTFTALIDTFVAAQHTAALLDADFPPEVMRHKWVAAKHSPTPWQDTYHHYLNQRCDFDLLTSLMVRYQLAEAIEKLNSCIDQVKIEEQPIDLKLAKTRRSA